MTKICSKCKIERDNSYFSKSSNTRDGLKCQCKICIAEYYKSVSRRNEIPIVDNKTCSTCKLNLESNKFYRSSASKDGLASRCKLCDKEQEKLVKTRVKICPYNEKECSKCKNILHISKFYSSSGSKDGLMYSCKECSDKYRLVIKSKEKICNKESKVCTGCSIDTLIHSFYKDSSSLDGLMSRCKDCCKAYQTLNTENIKVRRAEYLKNLTGEPLKRLLESKAKYTKNNPDKVNANTAKRRATKLNATPKWANQKAIRLIYKKCKEIEKETGIKHHVDHVVPLQSKLVCGLHVENNLQILPATENLKKHNSFWPFMPDPL